MSEPLFVDTTFPALRTDVFDVPTRQRLAVPAPSQHRPRFLMLYGPLRERNCSRLLPFEVARLLEVMCAGALRDGPLQRARGAR
jgi:arsenic resistance protein ArsH